MVHAESRHEGLRAALFFRTLEHPREQLLAHRLLAALRMHRRLQAVCLAEGSPTRRLQPPFPAVLWQGLVVRSVASWSRLRPPWCPELSPIEAHCRFVAPVALGRPFRSLLTLSHVQMQPSNPRLRQPRLILRFQTASDTGPATAAPM